MPGNADGTGMTTITRLKRKSGKIKHNMGFALSWVAVEGASPSEVNDILGLKPTGEREGLSGITIRRCHCFPVVFIY